MSETYASWGRATPRVPRRPATTGQSSDPFPLVRAAGGLLPRGNGRSYGDSCLNDAGLLVDHRAGAAIRSLDAETGVLVADAGVTLAEITRAAAPLGWFLPVTPGTQFVTLGGAVANDVHGKNHHRRGTLGRAVEALTLRRSDRPQPLRCTRQTQPELFAATIGGMGLTGLMGEITLRLMPVSSTAILQTTTRFDRLDDYFAMAEEADVRHEYAVAWIDSLATGRRFGRGHLIAGDHAACGDREGIARPPFARIPFTPPVSPLKGLALRAFNEGYFRKAKAGTETHAVPFDGFFYPLDRIGAWNRLYGPRGLHQHQSVVPGEGARDTVGALMHCARAHGQGSFLTVLKRFGDLRSPGLLSFPRPGYTLTLDFPNAGARTLRLLDALDAITVDAGGAVNPYKDARMSAETFAQSFPNWAALERLRDPALMSDFWRRTAGRLTLPAEARAAA
ncbi:FAD-binding oxidoreductase [Aureimonas pseudogalii]|uniref:FAD/FMN-containing dehydrogenase n=1 Tax=Aureimonas pseudogalii TaxID=1744844 RepID=A0A7W6EC81_9HYPH|nr:FAD-binding oxidoreductase [Aureimonas pseudogalii]MBB3998184.1 FAD/FMN-containing dehydrogenase [Aureimonas pseudogalii]